MKTIGIEDMTAINVINGTADLPARDWPEQ